MTDEEILAAADKILVERCRALAVLYDKTKEDWYLNMSWCLTEPVCPVANIEPEGYNTVRFAYHMDSPIAAMVASIGAVHATMIDGKHVEPVTPWSNPDDRERWPEAFGE
jgi:hypothetical protein